MFRFRPRLFVCSIVALVIAFAANAGRSIAQSRHVSRPIAAPKAFGVQRGGLGVTGPRGGHMQRAGHAQRAGGYRSAGRGHRQGGGQSGFHRGSGSRHGGSFQHGQRNSRHGGSFQHGRRSARRDGCHPGDNIGHRPTLHGTLVKNNWKQPRAAGKVPAINVFGSYYGYSPYSSTMIAGGHGLGYPYSSCYPRYGYGYHGACGFRYPVYGLYGAAGYRFDDDYYDDDYVEAGPYLDPVEAEIAMEAWEDRTQAALESEALDDFGERHADAEGPAGAAGKGASAMSPTVVETARQIGIALDRGDKAFEKGQYDQARAEYLQALALAGEDATARVALGLAEYALASFDAASSEIRKGVARAPSLAHSAFNLRSVYGNQRDFEAHVRILEDHVGQNPADSESRFLLGFVRYFSGDRAGGVALLETYLADPAHDDSVREFIETARVTMP